MAYDEEKQDLLGAEQWLRAAELQTMFNCEHRSTEPWIYHTY
jgi:hypothetical protein